jgi:hypothetical protein
VIGAASRQWRLEVAVMSMALPASGREEAWDDGHGISMRHARLLQDPWLGAAPPVQLHISPYWGKAGRRPHAVP